MIQWLMGCFSRIASFLDFLLSKWRILHSNEQIYRAIYPISCPLQWTSNGGPSGKCRDKSGSWRGCCFYLTTMFQWIQSACCQSDCLVENLDLLCDLLGGFSNFDYNFEHFQVQKSLDSLQEFGMDDAFNEVKFILWIWSCEFNWSKNEWF